MEREGRKMNNCVREYLRKKRERDVELVGEDNDFKLIRPHHHQVTSMSESVSACSEVDSCYSKDQPAN